MIAVLFAAENGPYIGLPGVDAWTEARDARLYPGPHPVVAHPPCERWGRYWFGGPSVKERKRLGDDLGCFGFALMAVRAFGGVLEHPAATHAWKVYELTAPPIYGGWVPAGDGVGMVCHVEQGNYGHPARKATWLYAVAPTLPELIWGPAPAGKRLDEGFHSKEERDAGGSGERVAPCGSIPRRQLFNREPKFRGFMPLVAVPRKPKERFLGYCRAARDATTWSEYKTAELKARVCSELIQDFWPDAWFLIICEADGEAKETDNPCCGIVYRTQDEFKE